jgi:hypothetical protein
MAYTAVEDRNSRALGYGMSAALAHLMRALVNEEVLSEHAVLAALSAAEADCRRKSHGQPDDIFDGAAGHIGNLLSAFHAAEVPT